MAPSSYVEREDIERAQSILEQRGYKVEVHPQTYAREHQSAGSHEDKAAAFHELWERENIKAIWAAGGGNRGLHLLEHIDFDRLKASPKTVIGFSDVTVLLNAIYAHTGITGIHGPVFKNLHEYQEMEPLLTLLGGESVEMPLNNATVLRDGNASGHLIGGNLSLFQYLPTTLPGDFWAGGILFLEDCNEELSRLDRTLAYLRRIGIFQQISGVIFGDFGDLKDTGRPFGYSFEDVINEHFCDFDGPIITNAPFGHGERLFPLRIGGQALVNTASNLFKTS